VRCACVLHSLERFCAARSPAQARVRWGVHGGSDLPEGLQPALQCIKGHSSMGYIILMLQ
jgi:hypothetical protein